MKIERDGPPPGNPFSNLTWSVWRRRGSFDDRADYTCEPIPANPFGSKW
jgi:hypothetical protein